MWLIQLAKYIIIKKPQKVYENLFSIKKKIILFIFIVINNIISANDVNKYASDYDSYKC